MLIIPLKEGENIERALKKYKKKFERTGMLRELRDRQNFTKPSITNRQMRLKAAYIEQLRREEM
ncbi:30S ribosomal protein S21 [Crocinitomix catalasitica]|uniref:30S ribosomal protein S21 n=1 Tax=Crocinitomix catalasitica TaxID=184607 RepID=UPI0004817D6E|nr:30S ribosomal protein S21 [Crocinitomix catalasitica]